MNCEECDNYKANAYCVECGYIFDQERFDREYAEKQALLKQILEEWNASKERL